MKLVSKIFWFILGLIFLFVFLMIFGAAGGMPLIKKDLAFYLIVPLLNVFTFAGTLYCFNKIFGFWRYLFPLFEKIPVPPIIIEIITGRKQGEITLTQGKRTYILLLVASLVFLTMGIWSIFTKDYLGVVFGLGLGGFGTINFSYFLFFLVTPVATFSKLGLKVIFSDKRKFNIPWTDIEKIGIQDIGLEVDKDKVLLATLTNPLPYVTVVVFLKEKNSYQFNPLSKRDEIIFKTASSFLGYIGGPIGNFYISQALAQAVSDINKFKSNLKDNFQKTFGVTLEEFPPLFKKI